MKQEKRNTLKSTCKLCNCEDILYMMKQNKKKTNLNVHFVQ